MYFYIKVSEIDHILKYVRFSSCFQHMQCPNWGKPTQNNIFSEKLLTSQFSLTADSLVYEACTLPAGLLGSCVSHSVS